MDNLKISLEIMKRSLLFELNYLPSEILYLFDRISLTKNETQLYSFILKVIRKYGKAEFGDTEKILSYLILRNSIQKEMINLIISFRESGDKKIFSLFAIAPFIISFLNISCLNVMKEYNIEKFELPYFKVFEKTVNSIPIKNISELYIISNEFYSNIIFFLSTITNLSKNVKSTLEIAFQCNLLKDGVLLLKNNRKGFPNLRELRPKARTERFIESLEKLIKLKEVCISI